MGAAKRNQPIVHKVGSATLHPPYISPDKRMNIIMGTNNHLIFKTRFGDAVISPKSLAVPGLPVLSVHQLTEPFSDSDSLSQSHPE